MKLTTSGTNLAWSKKASITQTITKQAKEKHKARTITGIAENQWNWMLQEEKNFLPRRNRSICRTALALIADKQVTWLETARQDRTTPAIKDNPSDNKDNRIAGTTGSVGNLMQQGREGTMGQCSFVLHCKDHQKRT